jgi:RNA polymerase-binding protein DksA
MDGKTLAEIRDSLLNKWKSIDKHSVHAIDHPDDLYEPHAEMIDLAQSLEQIGRDASLREVERRELLAVERALAKMSVGNFGVCEDCAEEIPAKRLMVLPEARLCAHCQAFEEKQTARTRLTGVSARSS